MRVLFEDSWDSTTIVQNVNSAYITDHIKTKDDGNDVFLQDASNVVVTFYDPVEEDHIYVVMSKTEAIATLYNITAHDFVDITDYARCTFLNPNTDEKNLKNYFIMN